MAKVLDLNSVQESILDLTLQDEARTVVHLDFPSEALVQELEAMEGELNKLKDGSVDSINLVYDLLARLISCNFDGFKTTGPELREKYRMTIYSAIKVYKAYISVIEEVSNLKN